VAADGLPGKWLVDASPAEQLLALLCQLLREWQQPYGHPSKSPRYHNDEYCQKARSLGLIFDGHRKLAKVEPGPFTELLGRHGVDEKALQNLRRRNKGESRMRKWECGCCIIRSTYQIKARCGLCGKWFKKDNGHGRRRRISV